jgi:hypothetical protein
MTDDIRFSSPPESFEGPNATLLPWNYVDVAMPDLFEQGSGRARIVMALPDGERPARYAAIDATTLKDPARTVDFIANLELLGLSPEDPNPRCFLGPETDLKPLDARLQKGAQVFEISAEPWPLTVKRDFSEVVLIIDAGIGFWNKRFRGASGPRFRGMRYLDFDSPGGGLSVIMTEPDIESFCNLADSEGNAAVMQRLGARFKASVFGQAANPNSDGLWHGTAIADLAAGAEAGTADNIALFGIELPFAVVADYSGSILTSTLPLILQAAIEMTVKFAEKPLTIVMPLGFAAGPQDGSHPAALAISAIMSATGRKNVRLILPAGNQLQDRCHAHLTGGGPHKSVHWELPPEDHSRNVIEMFGSAGQPVSLTLTAPGRSSGASVALRQLSFVLVVRDGEVIGSLLRRADPGSRSRTQLALAKTAITKNRNGAPYGRWTLSTETDLELWIARDDRNPVTDEGRPHRQSRFWDAGYKGRDANGALIRDDDPGSAIRRTGTLSALATALDPSVVAVEATERLGTAAAEMAGYSSRREDGMPLPARALVDDGWPARGTMAAANGGKRRMRVSGTSAAAGLHART